MAKVKTCMKAEVGASLSSGSCSSGKHPAACCNWPPVSIISSEGVELAGIGEFKKEIKSRCGGQVQSSTYSKHDAATASKLGVILILNINKNKSHHPASVDLSWISGGVFSCLISFSGLAAPLESSVLSVLVSLLAKLLPRPLPRPLPPRALPRPRPPRPLVSPACDSLSSSLWLSLYCLSSSSSFTFRPFPFDFALLPFVF